MNVSEFLFISVIKRLINIVKIGIMENYYEKNKNTLPIDFAVSIYTFFSGCYFKMKQIDKALEYWKRDGPCQSWQGCGSALASFIECFRLATKTRACTKKLWKTTTLFATINEE